MNKKLIASLSSIVGIVIAGYFLFQHFSGNTDLMMDYLSETESITDEYLTLLTQESEIEDEIELEAFTTNELLPNLERLLTEANQMSTTIENDKLLTVHSILIKSFETLVAANEKWLEGNDEAEDLFTEHEELYAEYEDQLDTLASKWGVEIEWQEAE